MTGTRSKPMLMSRSLAGLLLLCAGSTLTALPAIAQTAPPAATPCPEGRTFSGACVRPDLSSDMRLHILSATQPKLSVSSPALLPSQDSQFAQPRDRGELQRLHGVDVPNGYRVP
ncbi:hypothetical protein E8L99_20080 [Phreatobacter aquaticus]|uniref:Uncharacterized protein n=1 Tax=Phreatobacter aquaticus TaxID=2570229 RepID=A0A4D7QSC6_9HYPH|nr:hypothetical protein [Phreatobacter aquaticus]QCK87887.1 hypothetical protein E8L99_20080 [Phreatobacter aquaticus]